jgi:dienelactone hydrolase
MRRLSIALLVFYFGIANAAQVKIPWKGNYTHNDGGLYSPENKYKSGFSQNFLNGSPEEKGKVKKDGDLTGDLFKPKKTPATFIILMHGCGGYGEVAKRWAQDKAKSFLEQGYGVLAVDSFSPRGVQHTCNDSNTHWAWRRAEDAYSALDWLIEKGLADKDSVYVMGRSGGGSAVLHASHYKMTMGHQNRFAGVFAVSPSCRVVEAQDLRLPIMIFIGDKDQAVNHIVCGTLRSENIKMVLYRGVHHGYEDKGVVTTYRGWHLEYNQHADRDTVDQTLAIMKFKDSFRGGFEFR